MYYAGVLIALSIYSWSHKELDKQINEIAVQERYKDEISSLRCLNGVGTLTALALRCEVGDFRRFSTARSFMAFLGLVPSEHYGISPSPVDDSAPSAVVATDIGFDYETPQR